SDYAGASLDRKSTTEGCQFLGCRLISWKCKKQTVTKIHINNESTICILKNHVFHLKTKHIEIRHHFIRDSYKKKLIQMIKIHTDQNVADLLTKAFDVSRFQYLIARIGVNAGDSKLMLLGITYYCWLHNLQLLVNVNAVEALADKKKVIITESSIKRDLLLEDANGVDCLLNAAIFEQLALMGYEKPSQKLTFYKAFFSNQWKFLIHTILQCLSAKTTAWNEFSSSMASAIICLATNQNFNFFKYIFDNMVKNVDSMVKFWMYLRVSDEHEVKDKKVVSTMLKLLLESATTTTVDELTLAQTLIEIKAAKPKVKGVMIQEPSEFTTTTTTTTASSTKTHERVLQNLISSINNAELEEEERLTRQREEEANIALKNHGITH
ncbi:hypothetical protein Tco_1420310, partial [Tanacetum coccineum]